MQMPDFHPPRLNCKVKKDNDIVTNGSSIHCICAELLTFVLFALNLEHAAEVLQHKV